MMQEIPNTGFCIIISINRVDHHDHCLTMKVRIIEKIYHHTISPILSTPYRADRELFWIKELGTAMPYDCNDNIKGVGNLASPGCSEINVMSLFKTIKN